MRPDLEVTVTEDRWSVLSEMMLKGSFIRYALGQLGTGMAIGAISKLIWIATAIIILKTKSSCATISSI